MNAIHLFFHWPDGGVWSNIVASVLVGVIAWFWKIKPHLEKIHKHNELMRLRTEQLHKHLGIKK